MSKLRIAPRCAADQFGDDLLSIADVASLLGITTKSVYRYRSTGDFPEPIRLGPRLVRWRRGDISSWLSP
jgi:prophage regulatory protein